MNLDSPGWSASRPARDFSQSTDRGVAQSGSAPALGAGSRGFKSLRPDQCFQGLTAYVLGRRSAMSTQHLLHYAVERARPDGRVFVTTQASDAAVEIGIASCANGSGMAEPPANEFDPSFEVQGQRVAAGNWELFNSRQLIREHHGDIRKRLALS